MPAKIFIYGTLKRKFYNHHIMKSINATYLGDVITTNKHHLVVDNRYSHIYYQIYYQLQYQR